MKLRSVMSHNFSQVPQAQIPRSSFNRSHGYKTTMDAGFLVPIFVDEALPGDTFNLRMSVFARMSTPIVPVMDNMFCDFFFFAVPIRLIWNNWQKFNGEQEDPGDSTDFLTPQMVSTAVTGYSVGSIHDYFGLPTGVPGLSHSAFWHRAYNLIYNEWFRDQNLQNSVTVNKGDGPDLPTDYTLLRRGKRHDYFTSCLPWPQKGPSVPLPLGTQAPIRGISGAGVLDDKMYVTTTATAAPPKAIQTTATNPNPLQMVWGGGYGTEIKWPQPGTPGAAYNYADLSNATASTINALRQAFQLQRLYERDARGGTRYTEIIRSHFGVISPDARLQRPEYLGGGSTQITMQPVPQTSAQTGQPTPQGNLAAYGTFASSRGVGFVKSFTEHCVLIGLASVRADLNYQQGLNRMWSRSTRWDYYWPALSHIGEQAVLNKEIYAVGSANPTQDAAVFGYQERYAEYRYKPSVITGQFRSTYSAPLDVWHLAQKFTSLPVLNSTFIQENPPVARVLAVPTAPHFLFDSYFDLKCVRPMPVYSVPGMIDHF